MAKITINNIGDFRTIAAKYGVSVPAKQGRPPAVKLARAIVAAGDTIVPTEYFSGQTEYKTLIPTGSVGKSEYVVTGKRQHVKDGVKLTTKKGEPKFLPFKKTIAVGDVREFLSKDGDVTKRGRVSSEAFHAFLVDLFDGGEVEITSRVKVGAAVAAEQSAEPVSEPAKGEDTSATE